MSDQQGEMSFWDHLEELRWTILRCVIALVVFTIGSFILLDNYWDLIILGPKFPDFITYRLFCNVSKLMSFLPDFCDTTKNIHVFSYNLTSKFFTHMSTSFWMALLLTFPYLVFEVWKFVSPALYPNEKKSVRWVFSFGTVMFFIGCAVGYFLVFPLSLRFLVYYDISDVLEDQVALESYIDSFLLLIFIMGVCFELPLLSWLLSQVGLLKRSFFKRFRRHAFVTLLIIAALITPGGDPFTLTIVFLPLYGLYELSAIFVKKDKAEEEEEEKTDIAAYGKK